MEILVAILIIAVLAAVAFAVIQRQRGPSGAGTVDRQRRSPIGRPGRAAGGRDSMAAAVADHAQATDPHDVIAAEQRMQAQAGQVSAGLQARARQDQGGHAQPYAAGQGAYDDGTYTNDPRGGGYTEPAAANGYDPSIGYADTPSGYSAAPPTSDLHLDDTIDPQTGQRTDGYGDPDNDPRQGDSRYDGRTARDYDPNTENPEYR